MYVCMCLYIVWSHVCIYLVMCRAVYMLSIILLFSYTIGFVCQLARFHIDNNHIPFGWKLSRSYSRQFWKLKCFCTFNITLQFACQDIFNTGQYNGGSGNGLVYIGRGVQITCLESPLPLVTSHIVRIPRLSVTS